ncbi:hypothetical protein RJT34_18165 [Clitoria ternatea]|uniref:Uncharacterized protein n=1 Tax=Clitoria ternatea TaxID=43366 RepID=A0AAN9JBI9_CLITE
MPLSTTSLHFTLLFPSRCRRLSNLSPPLLFLSLESICGFLETLLRGKTWKTLNFLLLLPLLTEDLWITGANSIHSSQISSTNSCLTSSFHRSSNPLTLSFLGYAFWLPNNIQVPVVFSYEEKGLYIVAASVLLYLCKSSDRDIAK